MDHHYYFINGPSIFSSKCILFQPFLFRILKKVDHLNITNDTLITSLTRLSSLPLLCSYPRVTTTSHVFFQFLLRTPPLLTISVLNPQKSRSSSLLRKYRLNLFLSDASSSSFHVHIHKKISFWSTTFYFPLFFIGVVHFHCYFIYSTSDIHFVDA